MSVDIRTTFAQYLKGFLKIIKIPSLPTVFFSLMLPPTDNFLRMALPYLYINRLTSEFGPSQIGPTNLDLPGIIQTRTEMNHTNDENSGHKLCEFIPLFDEICSDRYKRITHNLFMLYHYYSQIYK